MTRDQISSASQPGGRRPYQRPAITTIALSQLAATFGAARAGESPPRRFNGFDEFGNLQS